MKAWYLLAGAIVCEVSASLALKASLDNPLWYFVVVTGYLSAFTLLAFVLRAGMALGVAYGVWGASGVALTALFAAAVFGEPLTPLMMGGIALVITGVIAIEYGSHRAHSAHNAANATAHTTGSTAEHTAEHTTEHTTEHTGPKPGPLQKAEI